MTHWRRIYRILVEKRGFSSRDLKENFDQDSTHSSHKVEQAARLTNEQNSTYPLSDKIGMKTLG